MKRLALILIFILASAPAWAAAIVSTQTEAAQNITTEHLLFTITASGEQVYSFQPSLSSLNGAAANIQFRLVHSLGNDTVLGTMSKVANAKEAITDTYYASRRMGPVALKNGEKALFYALSTNASDTSVTYVVDVIDELALPTGAATSDSIAALPQNLTGIALTTDVTTSQGVVTAAIGGLNNATQLIQRSEPPTAAANADAVLDEVLGAHEGFLTTLSTASSVTAIDSSITGLGVILTAFSGYLLDIIATLEEVPTNAEMADAITAAVSIIDGYITAAQGVVTSAITAGAAAVWTQAMSTLDDTANTIGSWTYNFIVNGRRTGADLP